MGKITKLVSIITLAWVGIAVANPELEKAREHFNEAQVLFANGKYNDAAAKFKEAYEAKKYPQFLFNAGVAFEKGKDYENAVSHYRQYLASVPNARDRDEIEARIAVLLKEIERLKKTNEAKTPSEEVKKLSQVKLRGVVIIKSSPPGATIWLDSKKTEPIGITPWEGHLDGRHVIYVELEGHSTAQDVIEPSERNRIREVRFVLTKFEEKAENYLGLLKVTSNVPGAQVFIDNKEAGAYGVTPFQKQLDEGTHKLWVTAEGYDTFYKEITIAKTKVTTIEATLSGSPVGRVHIRGTGIEKAHVEMDGQVLCERGPCRRAVKEGEHTFKIARGGYKSYSHRLDIQAGTESNMIVRLEEKPGRWDAVATYVLAAGLAGGSLYVQTEKVPKWEGIRDSRRDREDQLIMISETRCMAPGASTTGTAAYDACTDAQDAASDAGDDADRAELTYNVYKYGTYVGYGLAGVTAGVALYYTFRDKGPASTGKVDVRAIDVQPAVGLNYGGFMLTGRF